MSSPDEIREVFPYLPDVQKDYDESEESSSSPINSPVRGNRRKSFSTKAWSLTLKNKSRIISQGDLRFHVGMKVIAVLPFYFDLGSNLVRKNFAVEGIVNEIFYKEVGDADIPRETRLRSSPIPDLHAKGSVEMGWSKFESLKRTKYHNLDWAKPMIAKHGDPVEDNTIQTIVTSYELKLNPDNILSKSQIMKLNTHVANTGILPYKYELGFKKDEDGEFSSIIVQYRYIMGRSEKIYRKLRNLNPVLDKPILDDVNRYLDSTIKIYNDTALVYTDSDPQIKRGGKSCRFIVIDHICVDVFDIRFVIKPLDDPRQILAINKLIDFEVRLHYNIEDYYCFHPYDKFQFSVEPSYSDPLSKIREVLRDLFSNLKIYVVKKSLKRPGEVMFKIYENQSSSEVKYLEPGLKLEGFVETDIEVSKYVKGLAYPERELPSNSNDYIFFESKNYRGLDLDPTSPTFMEMVPVVGDKIYRDPLPNDILMGREFICEKGNFKGRKNLEWFYSAHRIRTIHYIFNHPLQVNENHPRIRRENFQGVSLFLFDLWIYGIGSRNPTRKSEFSKAFMSRYLWQALLRSEIEDHPNYEYKK